jgi:hypothetical protein
MESKSKLKSVVLVNCVIDWANEAPSQLSFAFKILVGAAAEFNHEKVPNFTAQKI